MTIRELLESSHRLFGALATNENLPASDAQDSLSSLNTMLDAWAVDGLLIHAIAREEFAISSSQTSRTIGATGQLVTSRPVQIVRLGIESNGIEYPVEKINVDDWSAIANKAQTGMPEKIFAEGTFPNDTLNFWPVPNSSYNLVIYSQKPFSALTSLSASFEFPPGYREAVIYNHAKRMAPEYGRSLTGEQMQIANEGLGMIRRKNAKPAHMTTDAPASLNSSGFDIYKGNY